MFRRLLSVLIPVALVGAAEPPKMKSIVYRGGIITFRVPATWKEEYEAEGGGTFYDDRPDSGTLRLNVLTFKAPEGKLAVDGYAHFAATPLKEGERLIRTAHGDGLKLSKKSTEEKGTKIDLYSWQLAHCAPPEKFYIASFTWTILSTQSSDPKFQQEVAFLTDEISRAQFHSDLGKL
jgi:hypothetical protein